MDRIIGRNWARTTTRPAVRAARTVGPHPRYPAPTRRRHADAGQDHEVRSLEIERDARIVSVIRWPT
jgi:hypothetical protein